MSHQALRGRCQYHFSAGEWQPREGRVCPVGPAGTEAGPACPQRQLAAPRLAARRPFVTLPSPRRLGTPTDSRARGEDADGESCCRRLAVTELAFPARRHMTHFAEINIVTLVLWEAFSQL